MDTAAYSGVADRLVERLDALVAANPEILRLDSPWDLFRVPGFNCDDLKPSLHQAAWALARVKEMHRHAND